MCSLGPAVHRLGPPTIGRRGALLGWWAVKGAAALRAKPPIQSRTAAWELTPPQLLGSCSLLPRAVFPQSLKEFRDAALRLRLFDFAASVLFVATSTAVTVVWRLLCGGTLTVIVIPGVMMVGVKLPALVVHLIWPSPVPVPVPVSATRSLLLAWWFVKVWWKAGLQWGVISAVGWQRSHFRSVLCPGCGRVPVTAAVCRRGKRRRILLTRKTLHEDCACGNPIITCCVPQAWLSIWFRWAFALTWQQVNAEIYGNHAVMCSFIISPETNKNGCIIFCYTSVHINCIEVIITSTCCLYRAAGWNTRWCQQQQQQVQHIGKCRAGVISDTAGTWEIIQDNMVNNAMCIIEKNEPKVKQKQVCLTRCYDSSMWQAEALNQSLWRYLDWHWRKGDDLLVYWFTKVASVQFRHSKT